MRSMRVFRHYDDLPASARTAVVALGNFDGVHRGHQAVLATARREAQLRGVPFAVVTFEPHPRSVFRPDDAPFRLTPFRVKAQHLEALGVEVLVTLHFDAEFARVPADQFVKRVLVDGIAATHVAVGYDFCFGHKRQGDAKLLQEMGKAHGFGLTVVQPVRDSEDEIFASSLIRSYLKDGQPARAAALLGHLWEMEGRVEPGERRGRAFGFPTANIDPGEHLQPLHGIYAVRAGIVDDATAERRDAATVWRDAVAYFGRRPAVGGDHALLEVHLFDFAEDLYGRHLRTAFIDFLRPDRDFDDLSALKAQIAADCRQARQVLQARAFNAGEVVGDTDP